MEDQKRYCASFNEAWQALEARNSTAFAWRALKKAADQCCEFADETCVLTDQARILRLQAVERDTSIRGLSYVVSTLGILSVALDSIEAEQDTMLRAAKRAVNDAALQWSEATGRAAGPAAQALLNSAAQLKSKQAQHQDEKLSKLLSNSQSRVTVALGAFTFLIDQINEMVQSND